MHYAKVDKNRTDYAFPTKQKNNPTDSTDKKSRKRDCHWDSFLVKNNSVNFIVLTVDATHRPVEFFLFCMLGLQTTFIMEDNGIKILVYNGRNG